MAVVASPVCRSLKFQLPGVLVTCRLRWRRPCS
jgi:hypothetical protein